MFSVTVDLPRGYFEVAMQGFWTLRTVEDFGTAVERAIRHIRATGRTPVSLCDLSNAMVQSQQVVAAFMAMMESPTVRSGRVAVYTPGALMKVQAMRANLHHPEFRFFTDKEAARAWLFGTAQASVGNAMT